MKSPTAVRWRVISGVTASLPAANVTGFTPTDSIVLFLPVKSRPIARKGAATMLTAAFLTTVQMASLRSAFHVVSGPDIGRFTFRPLSPSVMSATIMPSGRPMRFLTSSSFGVGCTWRFSTTISLEDRWPRR